MCLANGECPLCKSNEILRQQRVTNAANQRLDGSASQSLCMDRAIRSVYYYYYYNMKIVHIGTTTTKKEKRRKNLTRE